MDKQGIDRRTFVKAAAVTAATIAGVVPGATASTDSKGGKVNRADGFPIVYAPDRVELGRVFRIVLDVPGDQVPVSPALPASVDLVDRTDPERVGETIFYFRAKRVDRNAQFRFDGKTAGAEVIIDCLDRAGMLERREQGEIKLPRRWPVWEEPDELKSSRTIWRREDLERVLGWGQTHADEVRRTRESADSWVTKPDEALWNLLPKAEIPRWHFVNMHVGCPVHGDHVFKYSGYYPWKTDVEGMPYKVQCPVGDEWYPSNDIEADDFTSGNYPDDGFGCVSGDVKWAFVGVYQNIKGYYFTGGMRTLSNAFIQTGDEAMLHKIRVMLLRMADEWAYLSAKVEDRFRFGGDDLQYPGRPRWPKAAERVADLNRSGLVSYCINLAGDLVTYATAYDLAWEGLDDDADLLAMAGTRLGLRSGEEIRRYIEDHVFRVGAQTVIDGGAHSNLPHPQMGLANVLVSLNYRSGVRLADWLWKGGGQMRYWVPNFFFRDGSAYESTGGYNGMHVDATPPIARDLARLQEMRPDEYKQSGITAFKSDPKAKMLYSHLYELICIGRMYPQIGDGGGRPQKGNPPLGRMYSMTQDLATAEYAFETFGDAEFAKILWRGEGYEPGPESRVTRESVADIVRSEGPDIKLDSQVFDGYGIAVMRSGDGDQARAVWLRYGQARGHRQDDMLDIGLFAHRRNLMSQLGYPYTWSTHALWDGNWLTHYRVKLQGVDPSIIYRGALHSFAVTPGFQAARADGEGFRDLGRGQQRYEVLPKQPYNRWVAVVDVNDEDFYVVDVHRATGGDQHWWSFRGPDGEVTEHGLEHVTEWPDGTPAGKDIGYGEVEKLDTDDSSLHSLAHLYNCRRGEIRGPWGATWKLSGEEDLALRFRQLADDGEVIVGDGKPPISSREDPPYQFTWTLAHRTGKTPLSSQFITLIEASESGRQIAQNVERVSAKGTDAFEPVAIAAETSAGTDLIVSSSDGGPVTPDSGDWCFEGEYGLARSDGSGLKQISLTGGGRFLKGGMGIRQTTGVFRAEVAGGDFAARQVVLTQAPGPADSLVGLHVRFESQYRSSTYKVMAAEEVSEGVLLTLDIDIRIGEGSADGFEDGTIESHTHYPLAGYRYYHGAHLTTAAGEVLELDHIEPDTGANIESGTTPMSRVVLAAADGVAVSADHVESCVGKGGAFIIYDIGVGDRATFVLSTHLRKTGDGAWEGWVGPDTVLGTGAWTSGDVRVTRGTQSWDLSISSASDGNGALGLQDVEMGPLRIEPVS
jgi:hypothetical protein